MTFFLMFPSASGHEPLKGVSLLAGLIYGDEAGAGWMQMVLETELWEASLWWDRGRFIPAMQEHLVTCPLVQFAVSLPSVYSPIKLAFPPHTEAERAECCAHLGQRCLVPRAVSLGWSSLGHETFPEQREPSLPWAAPHSLQLGEPNLGFWAWAAWESASLHWGLSSGTFFHPWVVQQPS